MSTENPQDNLPEKSDKKWAKWGAKTRWGHGQPVPQATPEQKRAGWAKRKRNQELARLILGQKFIGQVLELDPKTGLPKRDDNNNLILIDSPFKQRLKHYFGFSDDQMSELSNEAAILLRMVGEAAERGDVAAAQAIMDRAYGKPKEYLKIEDEDGNKPIFQINVVSALPSGEDMPQIQTSENEIQQGDSGEHQTGT